MKEVILLKNGEIALKGLNRASFEERLIKNAKHALKNIGEFKFYRAQSTIYCEPLHEYDSDIMDEAVEALSKVFGVAALCRSCVVEKDMQAIYDAAPVYLKETLQSAKTFKVEAKRSDKAFPLKSPQICAEVGGVLLSSFPHLRVNVHEPDVVVQVEIRDYAAYIHAGQIPGAGGIPVGTGGRASLLLSGGIDSPVAGYMMAKRGLSVLAIHFASPPYTSEQALQKVVTLCEKLTPYTGPIHLTILNLTELQVQIREKCPEEFFTIIMRRFMMRLSERVSAWHNCQALITGESLGQVASQTLGAIACTQAACTMPVLRPLIGMDKEEIIRIAHKIDTFETSILPFEDCCTVFTPRHPKTKPKLFEIEKAELALDSDALMQQVLDSASIMRIGG